MTVCNLFSCAICCFPAKEEAMKFAGIDVHKKVGMVVVVDASMQEEKPARRRLSPCRASCIGSGCGCGSRE